MSINKTIHYCWFGYGEKPELLKQCISSWKEKCPDYKIIEWNESNFDIDFCKFTRQAYDLKKYAFVSDVARLWIVYNFGGHYLDTDVELKKSLDVFADYQGWFASDTIRFVSTGLGFGASEKSQMVKCMLDYYLDIEFNNQVCVNINTESLKAHYPEIIIFDKKQIINNCLFLGPTDYGEYARHYYTATWTDEKNQKKRMKKIQKIKNNKNTFDRIKWKFTQKIRAPRIVNYIESHNNFFAKVLNFMIFDLLDCGVLYYFKIIFNKIFKKIK